MPKKYVIEMSNRLRGKKKTKYVKSNLPKQFFRNCPDCGNEIGYKTEKYLKSATINNTICNSCSAKKFKKNTHFLSKEKIQKMAATKAGYNSWEEYQSSIPAKKKYAREVWRITRKQPINKLRNYNKRGKCGIDGAYQLDHIISIHEGFTNNIPPKVIGNIKNLQIIPWEENLLKSNSILLSDTDYDYLVKKLKESPKVNEKIKKLFEQFKSIEN